MKVRTDQDSYEHPAAESLIARLRVVHTDLRRNLEEARRRYKKNFDRKTRPAPLFKVGDRVWLNRKNINTTRPSLKLDSKRFGPFKITKVVGESKMAFELELPLHWRVHNVFHASLLDPYHANTIRGRTQPIPQPPDIVEGEPEYEVKEVLDSKIRGRKLWYFVDWVGYGPEERTWEPVEHLTHAEKLVIAYHQRHPQRPSPTDIPNRPRRTSAHEEGGTVTNDLPRRPGWGPVRHRR